MRKVMIINYNNLTFLLTDKSNVEFIAKYLTSKDFDNEIDMEVKLLEQGYSLDYNWTEEDLFMNENGLIPVRNMEELKNNKRDWIMV